VGARGRALQTLGSLEFLGECQNGGCHFCHVLLGADLISDARLVVYASHDHQTPSDSCSTCEGLPQVEPQCCNAGKELFGEVHCTVNYGSLCQCPLLHLFLEMKMDYVRTFCGEETLCPYDGDMVWASHTGQSHHHGYLILCIVVAFGNV
jgi:hypothetical protein